MVFHWSEWGVLKACFSNCKKHLRIIVGLLPTLILTIFLSGCAKQSISNSIRINLDDYSSYPKVVEQILTSFVIEQSDYEAYFSLGDGAIAEAFDTQAVGALETGIAKYWYPHYLATVIIAVDRDQTDVAITGWNDLKSTQQEVAFSNTSGDVQMLSAAMSYGLEGKHYTLSKTIELLASLQAKGRLKINTFESPIIICYDYQAVFLMENGRNIEIIIPAEGTFTYEKGLLSNQTLNFEGSPEKLLLDAQLRLPDHQGHNSIYPDEAAYSSAVRVDDYKHFAKTTQNVSALIEREVLHSKQFMSIDNREHLYFALIFIILVTIWTVSVLSRSMQKGISYAAFFTGIILIGWTLVRLVKYQIVATPILTRYLWYSFYIFQLSLPLVLLWMAWAIDKPKHKIFPPKWWRMMAILISILIIFVFTNDLHGQVFRLDLSRPDWGKNYSYGFGYYIVLFVSMVNLATVLFMLVQKSIRNPRKKGFIFPLVIFFLFGLYNYGYIIRNPLVFQTDVTIVTGLFTMLMFEASIRSGLIPVNTKYIDLFTRSPLKMQIINHAGETVLASASATPLDDEILAHVINLSPFPFLQDKDFLLFANPIPGGYAVWQEDIRKISQLQCEIQKSTQMLTEANAILAEEEKLKRSINQEKAKKQLMEQLEAEIAGSIEQLSTMIENLPHGETHSKETTRIALLLCYIKRRCNLFFREKETTITTMNELIVYMDELSQIAKYSNVQIATVNEMRENLAIRHATLFYDIFYAVIDLAVCTGCPYIINQLGIEEEFLTMRMLPSEELGTFKPEVRLLAAIAAARGTIVTKDLEETIGISSSFPKEGIAYD
jgi:hypothetical protein